MSEKLVPGFERYDDEGNDKTWEHEAVSEYWVQHYVGPDSLCVLCGNSGRIDIIPNALEKVKRGTYFCICPNGQVLRWHSEGKPIKHKWAEDFPEGWEKQLQREMEQLKKGDGDDDLQK